MSTADEVARDLLAVGARAGGRAYVVTRHHVQLLVTRAQAHASGRPGPRAVTGDFRRRINGDVTVHPGEIVGSAGTDHPAGRRLESGFVGADSLGRVYCVDAATEILTERGWKRYDEVVVGEEVLTLNERTWLAEWQPVVAVNVFEDEHPVMVINARTLSAVASYGHRWLVERYYGRKQVWIREWRTTEEMANNVRVPLVQKCADLPLVASVEDDVVELVGWFWTEGAYEWSQQYQGAEKRTPTTRPITLRISQSERVNLEKVERIRRVLRRLFGEPGHFADGAHWRERYVPQTGVVCFVIDRVGCWLVERAVEPPAKRLRPEFLRRLTQTQLDLLVDVSLLADGCTDQNGVTKLGQADEGRIRAWEMACILAGRPIVTRHTHPNGKDTWTTTLLRTSASSAFNSALRTDREHSRIEQRTERGLWCPTTPNGTWLARRAGTVYFTGNSQPPYPWLGPAFDETEPGFIADIADIAEDR